MSCQWFHVFHGVGYVQNASFFKGGADDLQAYGHAFGDAGWHGDGGQAGQVAGAGKADAFVDEVQGFAVDVDGIGADIGYLARQGGGDDDVYVVEGGGKLLFQCTAYLLGLQVVEEALLAAVQAHVATVRPTFSETTAKPAQAGVASANATPLASAHPPTTNTTSHHVTHSNQITTSPTTHMTPCVQTNKITTNWMQKMHNSGDLDEMSFDGKLCCFELFFLSCN